MEENEFSVRTADGEMTTFVAHPPGGPWPVALLFMDGVGYREQVRANARRFAEAGYCVVAPDLFYRSGKGVVFDFGNIGGQRDRMLAVISEVTPARTEADTEAALAAVAADPAAARDGPKVCVGYCMGARVALHIAASRPDVVAAAGIHPGNLVTETPDSPHHELPGVKGELYFAFAEIDRTATPELVDRFRAEMERVGVRGTVERLAGVTHGFAMADLPVYDAPASERHFERTLDLWRRNLPATVPG